MTSRRGPGQPTDHEARPTRGPVRAANSNPYVGVHYEGMSAIFTNDWGNRLVLDLMSLALR